MEFKYPYDGVWRATYKSGDQFSIHVESHKFTNNGADFSLKVNTNGEASFGWGEGTTQTLDHRSGPNLNCPGCKLFWKTDHADPAEQEIEWEFMSTIDFEKPAMVPSTIPVTFETSNGVGIGYTAEAQPEQETH